MYRFWLAIIALGVGNSAIAQTESTGSADVGDPASAEASGASEASTRAPGGGDDPYAAYLGGDYGAALAGFVDQQVKRPDHPGIALNVGNAHYQMKNYAEAEKAFSTAAFSAETDIRAEALYNLGNTAFRQGELEQAVELYKASLESNPDDTDAKFNLEFVRDEMRRRHEEAQKRQDQQQQKQDGEKSSDQEKSQEQQNPESGSQDGQPQPDETGEDSDGDGLSDATERQGENPTDPSNPDTDGDGLKDGAEDLNADGKVDSGETDPNKADSDGDGVPDSQDQSQDQGGGDAESTEGAADEFQNDAGLTPEAAERYLQALQEGRPQGRRRGKPGQRRPAKDW